MKTLKIVGDKIRIYNDKMTIECIDDNGKERQVIIKDIEVI